MITNTKNYKGSCAPACAITVTSMHSIDQQYIAVSKLPYGTYNFECDNWNLEIVKVYGASHAIRWDKGFSRHEACANSVDILIGEHAKLTEDTISNFEVIKMAQDNVSYFAGETAVAMRGF